MTEITQLRLAMSANGYQPLPAQGKRVLLEAWPTKTTATSSEIASWGVEHPQWVNTSTLTGRTPAIDGDIRDPAAAEAFEELVRDWLDERGRILVRIGEAPKRAILCRTTQPFAKIKADFVAPSGSTHKIEILGDGQQLVVAGVHPDTQKPYTWHGGEPWTVSRSELPEITEAEARAFIDRATAMLEQEFDFRRAGAHGNGRGCAVEAGEFVTPTRTAVNVEQELADIHFGNIHDTWLHCMGSLLRAGVLANDVMRRLKEAAKQSPRCQDDPRKNLWCKALAEMMTWYVHSDPTFIGNLEVKQQQDWHARLQEGHKPRLVWRDDHGLQVRRASGQQTGDENDNQSSEQNGSTGSSKDNKQTIEAKPFTPFDPATIPPREWLYGNHYQRGIVTATVGPGGGGKSSLDLVELIAICTGRNLLGEQPIIRTKAWYHNAEEPWNELMRRLAAVCQHYEIPQSELVDWLHITSGIEMPIRIATAQNSRGVTLDKTATEQIIQTILNHDIGIVSFDPLVAHHTITENATGDMDQVAREFIRIANVTDCAIEIVHHTRKPAPGQEELSVIDSRGAGALIDAVRSARVLNVMSATEAQNVHIDEADRRLHFRINKGKANMTPPAAATWYKFVGVDLPNSDNVGVVTQWAYPTNTAANIPDAVCTKIQAEAGAQEYKANARSPDWIGRLVARILGINLANKNGKAAVEHALAALYSKGVITAADGKTGGHPVRVVMPGPWKATD
jgi:hypothetical protein